MNSRFTAFSILNSWAICISNRITNASITYQGSSIVLTVGFPWNLKICQPVSAEPKAIPTSKNEINENTTFKNIIRMVEYPTLKFSRMAAGIISNNAIQLQFLLNQALLRVKLSNSTSMIEKSPQGNRRKVEGL